MIRFEQYMSFLILQVKILQDKFVKPFNIYIADPYGHT